MPAPPVDDVATSRASVLPAGGGRIETRQVDGQTRIVCLASHAPLKLLVPRNDGRAVSVFSSTYGGGLLAGDSIGLDVDCGPETNLFLRSQSATKVYRSDDGRSSVQRLSAAVGENATLVSLPDPVTCFAGARYAQRQSVDLAGGASALLLDWMTSGRSARGETWAFDRFETRTEVWRDEKYVFRDATLLDQNDLPLASSFRGGRFSCVATLAMIGPGFAGDALTLRNEVDTMPVRRRADLIVSTSVVAGDGLLVRLAATSTERATAWLVSRLQFLARLSGGDPFGRKW